MRDSMKILITGGAGFIGTATALLLLERGHEVIVLDNFHPQIHGVDHTNSYLWQLVDGKVELARADMRDESAVHAAVNACDAVLHLAAETGTGQSMYAIKRYVDVNVGGTAVLLEAIQARSSPLKSLVVASSRSVYGEGAYWCTKHGPIFPERRAEQDLSAGQFEPVCPVCRRPSVAVATTETAPLRPASVYATTKLAQENMALNVGAAKDIQVFAFRYQNVYGAGQSLTNPYTGILSIFSREMLAGRPIEIFEDGLESRDFVHVQDVAMANVLALESRIGGQQVLNVGTGIGTSVIDITRILGCHYGYDGPITISGRYRAGDIRHNFSNNGPLADALGFQPAIALQIGIESFCEWVPSALPVDPETSDYRKSLIEMAERGLMRG